MAKVPDKFVEVWWLDAVSGHDWMEEADLPDPTVILSRGWLVKETDKAYILSSSIDTREEGCVSEILTIPRGSVVDIRKLTAIKWQTLKV